jgi:hypothetical protein
MEIDRLRLEEDLRARLTDRELKLLVAQLQGAVSAIDLLRTRAPHVVEAFFSQMNLVSTHDVSDQAKQALEALAMELRAARMDPPKPMPSRQALRLSYSEGA